MRSSINQSIRVGISLRAGPVGRPKADIQPDMRVNTRQSAPFEVGLIISIISLHTSLVEKYVKIHKIDLCYLL